MISDINTRPRESGLNNDYEMETLIFHYGCSSVFLFVLERETIL